MAFGFQGPISNGSNIRMPGDNGMIDYALSRTYRILSAERNSKIASCKICGTALPRDHGFQVSIVGLVLRTPKTSYLCLDCFLPIKAASESFPLHNPLPSWWKILDRKPVSKGEPIPDILHPSGTEIDRMIKQREKQPSGKRRIPQRA